MTSIDDIIATAQVAKGAFITILKQKMKWDSFKSKENYSKTESFIPEHQMEFDLEDCDRILRFESDNNIIKEIIILMKILGFECEALEKCKAKKTEVGASVFIYC